MYKLFPAAALAAITIMLQLYSPVAACAAEFDHSAVRGRTVMLDAGHGGDDSGAIRHGVKESALNLAAALELKKYLELIGARVVMTRDTDRAVSLNARYEAIEKLSPDLFVSLHHNDASDSFYAKQDFKNYTEVYFSALFDGGMENILSGLAFYEAFARLHGVGAVKLKPGYFRVIRNKKVPSVLMEPFFMGEERLVRRAAYPSYARHEALVYLRAIANYFSAAAQEAVDHGSSSAAASGDTNETNKTSAIKRFEDYSSETFSVFLSAGANCSFLKTAAGLLEAAGIRTAVNSDDFLGGQNISSHYVSKLSAVEDLLEKALLPYYIEAIRSNSVEAKAHVSLSFDRTRPSAAYAYYKSENGKKLCERLIETFRAAGIALEFKPDSFYILSSTSAVTAAININPEAAVFDPSRAHDAFRVNMAVYSAVKGYLSAK